MGQRLMMIMMSSFLMIFSCCLEAEGGAHVSNKAEATIQPQNPPSEIWVTDFEIDVADVSEQKGIRGGEGPLRKGPLRGEGILRSRSNPEYTARKVVDLLSLCLTQELKNRSLPAKRLSPGQPLPDKGWLIQGQFLEVDEGNRLRRAIVGFGAGATQMQIEVTVANREIYPDRPFLIIGTEAETGKMPGAVVTMNPYVAAAKFVMAKNDSEKNVRSTARQIASEIVDYMKAHGLMRSK